MSALVRPAGLPDANRLAEIEAAAAAHPWTEADLAAILALPTTQAFVIEAEGQVAGHLLASRVHDEGEVLELAVHPDHHRKGFARELLRACVRGWRAAGVRQAFLDVREDNHAARRLYAAEGWEPCGRRPRYYHDGTDALLYELTL